MCTHFRDFSTVAVVNMGSWSNATLQIVSRFTSSDRFFASPNKKAKLQTTSLLTSQIPTVTRQDDFIK